MFLNIIYIYIYKRVFTFEISRNYMLIYKFHVIDTMEKN